LADGTQSLARVVAASVILQIGQRSVGVGMVMAVTRSARPLDGCRDLGIPVD
jgi:hypothetical protein